MWVTVGKRILVSESVIKWFCVVSPPSRKSNSTFTEFAAGVTPKNRRKRDGMKECTHYFISSLTADTVKAEVTDVHIKFPIILLGVMIPHVRKYWWSQWC